MAEQATKRLNQIAKDLNVGLSTIVDFLSQKGFYIENKPTTKITQEQLLVIERAFSSGYNANSQRHLELDQATTLSTIIAERNKIGQPGSFFKYFGTNSYNIDSLENNYIYLSPPTYFNDPYDCIQDLIEFPSGQKANRKLIRQFTANLETIGVSCFSTVNNSLLLWAHYANGHKGFCLEFHYDSSDPNSIHLLPICYRTSFHKLSFQLRRDDSIFNMIYTKSKEWSYEKEWRLLKTGLKDENDRKFQFKPSSLKSIYIGIKCDFIISERIKEIKKSKYPNAKLYQAHRNSNSFKIDFSEVVDI